MYRETKDDKFHKMAIQELTDALDFWKKFASQATQKNKNPLWTNRVGHVDWEEITTYVEMDIKIANENI
jgi:pterin-4a-carbinolamine dehydratase